MACCMAFKGPHYTALRLTAKFASSDANSADTLLIRPGAAALAGAHLGF